MIAQRDHLQLAKGKSVSADVCGVERPVERAAEQAVQEDREADSFRGLGPGVGDRKLGPAVEKCDGPTVRLPDEHVSPPARGIIAASSAYVSAPARVSTPAASHAASTSHGVSTLHIMTRVLRKMPVPMTLPTTTEVDAARPRPRTRPVVGTCLCVIQEVSVACAPVEPHVARTARRDVQADETHSAEPPEGEAELPPRGGGNHVGRLLANHVHRACDEEARHARKHGRVHDAQASVPWTRKSLVNTPPRSRAPMRHVHDA